MFSSQTAAQDFATEGATITPSPAGWGFQVEFENGWMVGVYWEYGTKSSYRRTPPPLDATPLVAEVMVWRIREDGSSIYSCEGERGYQSRREVREILDTVAVLAAHDFDPVLEPDA